MSFATPLLNEIKEVKINRASIHEKCRRDVNTTDPEGIKKYESIAFRNLERVKENIFFRKQRAKEAREEITTDGIESIPNAGALRAIPNVFLRSALFKIEVDKKAPFVESKIIICQSPYKIIYTGPVLTQADLDVWLSLIYLGGGVKFGCEFDFSIGDLLIASGKTRTGPNSKMTIDSLYKLNIVDPGFRTLI